MKKILQFVFSVILIYFAFRKIDVVFLFKRLLDVPIELILFTLVSGFFLAMIAGYRWSTLLLKKSKFSDVFVFVKCIYLASFYGLFLPTAMASDLVKWLPLVKKYPEIGKIKIAGSVLIDRVLGASAFFPVAFVSAIIGKIIGFNFPNYLLVIFSSGCFLILVFYFALFLVDFEKVFSKFNFFKKLIKVMDLLKKENKKVLFKAFLISIILQVLTVIPVWVISLFLGVNFSLISVYIFIPMVGLMLMLPISIAGFGAREQLYLFFFSQIGIETEKILLVSTYSGIMGVTISLISGMFLFLNNKSVVKTDNE